MQRAIHNDGAYHTHSQAIADGTPFSIRLTLRMQWAFTLVELLVVISVLAVLAVLIFTAVRAAFESADNVRCITNLKQIGTATAGYCADHDGYFPGPSSTAVVPRYYSGQSGALPAYLDKYLSSVAADGKWRISKAFVCPAYARQQPLVTAPNYLTGSVRISGSSVRLWGHPAYTDYYGVFHSLDPAKPQSLLGSIDRSKQSAATSWAVRDADRTDFAGWLPRPTWLDKVPEKPIHRGHRNALFHDFHVAELSSQ